MPYLFTLHMLLYQQYFQRFDNEIRGKLSINIVNIRYLYYSAWQWLTTHPSVVNHTWTKLNVEVNVALFIPVKCANYALQVFGWHWCHLGTPVGAVLDKTSWRSQYNISPKYCMPLGQTAHTGVCNGFMPRTMCMIYICLDMFVVLKVQPSTRNA